MCLKEAIQNKVHCPETLVLSGKEIFMTLVLKKHCITDESIWFVTQNLLAYTHTYNTFLKAQ